MSPLPTIENIRRDASRCDCNRCGRCCRLPSGKDCRNLGRKPDGTTYCLIWNNPRRVGTPIGEGCVCTEVVFVPRIYKDCPYNEVKRRYGIVREDATEEE